MNVQIGKRMSGCLGLRLVWLGLCLWSALAHSTNLDHPNSEPPSVVQARGQDSLIERFEMGPASTTRWRQLQSLIAAPEKLQDFSELVTLFELSAKDPLNHFDLAQNGNKYRLDAKDSKFHSIRSFEYWHWCDGKYYPGCMAALDVFFEMENICISNMEVRRIYGETKDIAIPSHGEIPSEIKENPVGFGYTEIRNIQTANGKPLVVMFAFSPSGCTRMIEFRYPLTKN